MPRVTLDFRAGFLVAVQVVRGVEVHACSLLRGPTGSQEGGY